MLKLALEGLEGCRSRQAGELGDRGAGWTLAGSDLFHLPQHLYPPSRAG
jgi:hypothetical protein